MGAIVNQTSSRKGRWPPRFSTRALLAFTAAVALILALWPRSSELTQAHFNLLKTGMEQAEIEKLLGPPRNRLRTKAIVWDPQQNGKPISAFVTPGPLKIDFFPAVNNNGHQAVWLTNTGLVAVHFGNDGKLQNKYFSTVHSSGPPAWLDWISIEAVPAKRRIGMGPSDDK